MDWDEAAVLYRDEGWTIQQIADHYGWSSDHVSRGFRERGVQRPEPSRLHRTAKGKKLYSIWMYMHQRCSNPNCDTYHRFGARGVRVCMEWNEFPPFYHWACESGYTKGDTLVLLDPSGDFEPSNCRFGTRADARRHLGVDRERPPRRFMTAFGETKPISKWFADPRCLVTSATVYKRMEGEGWSFEQAISTPAGEDRRRRGRSDPRDDPYSPRARVDWKEALRLRRELDLTDQEIADRLDCGKSTITLGFAERRVRKATRRGELRLRPADKSLYRTWGRIIARCTDREDAAWERFGARGVDVCAEWRESFEAFRDWSRANGWKPKQWLIREDPDGDFSPQNCRWGSRSEGARRRSAARSGPRGHPVTAFDEAKSLADWARDPRCAVAEPTLRWRIEQGMDPEEAITMPPRSPAAGPEIEAFGESKIAADWVRDPRCRVGAPTLYYRLARGWDPERAMTAEPG